MLEYGSHFYISSSIKQIADSLGFIIFLISLS